MKKLITIVFLVVALLAITNVSYGDGAGSGDTVKKNEGLAVIDEVSLIVEPKLNKNHGVVGFGDGTLVGGDYNEGDSTTIGDISAEGGAGGEGGSIGDITTTGGSVGNIGAAATSNNANTINVVDNSVYAEVHPTGLLNPTGYVPLADKLYEDELHVSKSIFSLQRKNYSCKELTRFANPGRFLAILWPEWENKYHIEIATFRKYKAKKTICVISASKVYTMGLTKIGEGQAYAKDLNKSEHQVMAAVAVRAAEAGASVVVYKGFSNPLVKVNSFVIGGGGTQVGGPASVFNGASGIGSSSNETLTRACVVVELYR